MEAQFSKPVFKDLDSGPFLDNHYWVVLVGDHTVVADGYFRWQRFEASKPVTPPPNLTGIYYANYAAFSDEAEVLRRFNEESPRPREGVTYYAKPMRNLD